MRTSRIPALGAIVAAVLIPLAASARQDQPAAPEAAKAASEPFDVTNKGALAGAVTRGVELLLKMQEAMDDGAPRAEWPYEGVYRVGREIPIGYRVGGSSIACMALLQAPGYADDAARKDAVARALRFVCESTSHPLMNPDYDGGYDVRGWGYTYAVLFILRLKDAGAVPEDQAAATEEALKFYVGAIQQTEINEVGGWNYARSAGRQAVSPMSPFMTSPTLQALFEAREHGCAVDDAVVERAVTALERGRTSTGSFVYSGASREENGGRPEAVPGSVGRMVASETALFLCGRSSVAQIRGAVDSFIVHWEWLNKRRSQTGTHAAPYSIAPYYFYYAHYYAAQAVEQLPAGERAEYRRRINTLLFSVRLEDGSWNDRVFPRSRNFGTAMAIMAVMAPDAPKPARWEPAAKKDAPGEARP
jgi:hypothetical protein